MLLCKFCSKEYIHTNGLKNHERRCPSNKDRVYVNGMLGKKGSNAWVKAKLTGIPYVLSEETIQKMSKSSSGRTHTEETKALLSKKRIKYLEENPDKVPYLMNHHSRITYPEKYFIECFNDIIEDKEFRYRVGRYELDFANPSKKMYLEIDGEQHYVDKKIAEHDIKRTKILLDLGWVGIRVRWAHFQRLTEIEKKNKIQEIRFMMKWLS